MTAVSILDTLGFNDAIRLLESVATQQLAVAKPAQRARLQLVATILRREANTLNSPTERSRRESLRGAAVWAAMSIDPEDRTLLAQTVRTASSVVLRTVGPF